MRGALSLAFGAIGVHNLVSQDWTGLAIAVLAAVVAWLQSRRK